VSWKSLTAKGERAIASARMLLDAGDTDGACNRAYYAMLDAARAALTFSGHDLPRSHRGTLAAFSEHMVKNARLPTDMGRNLKRAETLRLLADYEGASVDAENARKLVEDAERFVAAIRAELSRRTEPPLR
jgi:uncharacterized protein (UPF0332 family)